MSDYWGHRWANMRRHLDEQPLAEFRSNDIGHDIVRQQYNPGDPQRIVNWTTSRVAIPLCGDPLVGKPKREHVAEIDMNGDTYSVTPDSCMFAYSAATLAHHIDAASREHDTIPDGINILEIGPGYGGLIERIRAALRVRCYISVDGRPPQTVQRYFLAASGVDFPTHFTQTLSSTMLEAADLVIASHCFGEMDTAEVNDYIDLIQVSCRPGTLFYVVTWRHEALHYALSKTCSRLQDYVFDDKWERLVDCEWPYDYNPCQEILMRRT